MTHTLNIVLAAALALALTYIVAYSAATNHMRLRLSNDNETATRSNTGIYIILFALVLLVLAILGMSDFNLPDGVSDLPRKDTTIEPTQQPSLGVSVQENNEDTYPTRELEEAVSSTPTDPVLSNYALQVGAFGSYNNAELLAKYYRNAGHLTQVVRFSDGLYRTLITPEHASTEADVKAYAKYYGLKGFAISLKDA